MKAYQCSKCANLEDYEEYCGCSIGIDVRIGYRKKGDAERCKKNYKFLSRDKQWHQEFSWER